MNQKTISFKVDDYIITLHRGEEEPKEIEQKRMARYVNCLYNMAMKLIVRYFEEYCPELNTGAEDIIQKHIQQLCSKYILNFNEQPQSKQYIVRNYILSKTCWR